MNFKPLAVFSAALSVSICALAQNCAPVPAGNVGWWPGNDNTQDYVGGTFGTWIGPAAYASGVVDDGFQFDGGSGGIIVAPVTGLDLTAFTIETWLRRSDPNHASEAPTGGVIFGHGLASWAFALSDAGNLFLTDVGSSSVTSSLRITDTAFHHVAVTDDGATVTFYVDGVEDAPMSYAPGFSFGQQAAIGSHPDGSDTFEGILDEPAIYNRALSAAEIQSIHQGQEKCAMPIITQEPVDFEAVAGSEAAFGALATGASPFFFQWLSNSVPIGGATNAILRLSDVSVAESGALFSVVVSNANGTVSSSNAVLIVSSASCVPPLANLANFWTADGNAQDLTGLSDGMLVGSTSFVPGISGSAFSFTEAGDAVVVGNVAALQGAQFSIDAWIQRSDPQTVGASPGGALILSGPGGDYGFGFTDGGALIFSHIGVDGLTATSGFITNELFHNVAMTDSNGLVSFYVDGQPAGSGSYAPGAQFGGPVAIGRTGDGGNTFLGAVDNVSVYGRALDPAEIGQLYQNRGSLVCLEAPVFAQQPVSQTNVATSGASFTALATSVLLEGYQWQLDGTNLSGATNAALSFMSFSNAAFGPHVVTVIASNLVGSTASSNAVLYLAQPVAVADVPQTEAAVIGETATLSALASGTPPISYQWLLLGRPIAGATNSSYTIPAVGFTNLGEYDMLASNPWSATTNDVALLELNPEIQVDGLLGTNFAFTNIGPVQIAISSTFTNGTVFYTLDGSEPSFYGTLYNGPFELAQSAVVRAAAYDADFNLVESIPVTVAVLSSNALIVNNPGGGMVTADPPGGIYLSSQTVQLTAVPLPGWVFMYWSGSISNTNPVVELPMTYAAMVYAVFGTSPVVHASGPGTIQLIPNLPLYPYGSTVLASAQPQPGDFLALWGGALSGIVNPAPVGVTAAHPTISALFSRLPPGYFSVVLKPNGSGAVDVAPLQSYYASNAMIEIDETAGPNGGFYYWSGTVDPAYATFDALIFPIRSNIVLTANFASGSYPSFSAPQVVSNQVQLSFSGVPSETYNIEVSTNLVDWSLLEAVADMNGPVQLTDSLTNGPQRFYRAVEQ